LARQIIAVTQAVPSPAKIVITNKAINVMLNLISLSPELAQSLIKWVTVGSVIFGVLTGLGAGLTFACQSILDAENDKKIAIAQKDAAESKLNAEKLKNAITYRTVSDDQKQRIDLFLINKPKRVVIYYTGSDVESFFYAQSIKKNFESIGIYCDLFATSSVIYYESDIILWSTDLLLSKKLADQLRSSNFNAVYYEGRERPQFTGTVGDDFKPEGPEDVMMIISTKSPPNL